MSGAYRTAEENLPEDTDGDVTLQVADADSREIFLTRARIARTRSELDDPDPLTVVKGPHENIDEEWYIEILETDIEEDVDTALLRECIDVASEGSDLLNARSEELRAMLTYLVETGEYDSLSAAVRSLLSAQLSEAHPDLVEQYVAERTRRERDDISEMFRGEQE